MRGIQILVLSLFPVFSVTCDRIKVNINNHISVQYSVVVAGWYETFFAVTNSLFLQMKLDPK